MDHFDISFACSFFSKSWEVTNYGFLDVAHLPVSRCFFGLFGVSLSASCSVDCGLFVMLVVVAMLRLWVGLGLVVGEFV